MESHKVSFDKEDVTEKKSGLSAMYILPEQGKFTLNMNPNKRYQKLRRYRNSVHGYIDIKGKRCAVIQEQFEDNNCSDIFIPRQHKSFLLPLVIVIEIMEMFVMTGAVAFTIVTTRMLTINLDRVKLANTEINKCMIIIAYVLFALKWRKLMPAISFACYVGIGLICIYNIYLAGSLLLSHHHKNNQ